MKLKPQLPTLYEQGHLATLKHRARRRERRLLRAIQRLEESVAERLPPAQIRREVRRSPMRLIALGFLGGMLLGGLFGKR